MFPNGKIRDVLHATSLELTAKGNWPIRLKRLLQELGIRLQFETANGRTGKAYFVFDDPPTIIVIRPAARSAATEHAFRSQRFSVAHELGHWIIWRRFGALPDPSSYWRHEALCNEFAARLLLPPPQLDRHLSYLQDELQLHPINYPNQISEFAGVSWDVAARSISALPSSEFAYLRINVATSRQATAGPPLRVVCSSISDKLGSFVGQGAVMRDLDTFCTLRALDVTRAKLTRLSLKAGRLRLVNASCFVRRETSKSWIVLFQPKAHEVSIAADRNTRNGYHRPNVEADCQGTTESESPPSAFNILTDSQCDGVRVFV